MASFRRLFVVCLCDTDTVCELDRKGLFLDLLFIAIYRNIAGFPDLLLAPFLVLRLVLLLSLLAALLFNRRLDCFITSQPG